MINRDAVPGASPVMLRDMVAANMRRLVRRGSGPRTEELWALRDVSFDLHAGERVGIIGRNGSGKSTLLKMLSRISEPTVGKIRMRGRVASFLEVGTGFHPELSGRENIYLNGAILGMSRPEISRKFDEIVAFAEVERFLDTPVKRYSSGMYVRLGFAIAAHLDPDVLIVDEVLAVGDVQFQEKCLSRMEEVGRSGRTVLFVSHNVGAVARFCNRGIYLDNGVSEGVEDVASCIQKYLRFGAITNERSFEPQGPVYVSWANVAARPDEIVIEATVINALKLHDVVLGFTIYDADSAAVFSSDARNDTATVRPLVVSSNREKITVRVTQPTLRSGRYFVTLSLGDMAHEYWAGEKCLAFEMVNALDVGSQPRSSVGSILPNAEWETAPMPDHDVREAASEQSMSLPGHRS
jgi:lipopolysaccharide transport system ATP-binding protein